MNINSQSIHVQVSYGKKKTHLAALRRISGRRVSRGRCIPPVGWWRWRRSVRRGCTPPTLAPAPAQRGSLGRGETTRSRSTPPLSIPCFQKKLLAEASFKCEPCANESWREGKRRRWHSRDRKRVMAFSFFSSFFFLMRCHDKLTQSKKAAG